ncbi:MAG: protein-glutamate O-methyltransferase CheR [Proteobacteria bacterium]|nr:protein-glutamate O-methyltransferase CheR [Pseudomonadota bacterium]
MAATASHDAEVDALLDTLFRVHHYDFRAYSRVSLRRRLAAAVERLGYADLAALHAHVARDGTVFNRLLGFLTVQVSEMFRDPHYFLALRESVVPLLSTYPSLRVWVAGCSSGEEAYSLAILLHEEGLLERTMIYATDINPVALEKAAAGIYPVEAMRAYTTNYQQAGGKASLSDYYTAAYDNAVMSRPMRERITFADHSLATDTVFAEVHLVSCRNVLIYFDAKLQAHALGLFADALCRRGFLGLGARESVRFTAGGDRFADFAREDRIFRKVA